MKVIKIGALWCSSCLIMKPRWVKIEKELSWLNTEYFDADENQDLIKKYLITDYPCFIFLDKDNKEIHREYGEVNKDKLIEIINDLKDK
jgi:thiol-disulfide isomerase/thioredoxin